MRKSEDAPDLTGHIRYELCNDYVSCTSPFRKVYTLRSALGLSDQPEASTKVRLGMQNTFIPLRYMLMRLRSLRKTVRPVWHTGRVPEYDQIASFHPPPLPLLALAAVAWRGWLL